MNLSSARALVWVAAILAIVGPIATSYAAAFLGPLLAAVIVLFPAAFGRGRTRLVACAVLALSVFIAVSNYPDYRRHMQEWEARAKSSVGEATDVSDP